MSDRREVVAVIPARGGSKGLPRKNIRLLAGRPMLAYTIEAALGSPLVSRTIVTTEDPEIRDVARAHGSEIIARPAELATDAAPTSTVTRHVLETLADEGYEPDDVLLLQPTSPLRSSRHVTEALGPFHASDAASVVSVTPAEHHPRKTFTLRDGRLEPLFAFEDIERPRQKLEPAYRANGAIFALGRAHFLTETRFVVPPVLAYEMDAGASIDVDSAMDLRIAEAILADGGVGTSEERRP